MGARSLGRESALQMLFSMEAGGGSAERVIAAFWRETPGDPEGREFADAAVRGVAEGLDSIDESIRKASTNWRLERMARVDLLAVLPDAADRGVVVAVVGGGGRREREHGDRLVGADPPGVHHEKRLEDLFARFTAHVPDTGPGA